MGAEPFETLECSVGEFNQVNSFLLFNRLRQTMRRKEDGSDEIKQGNDTLDPTHFRSTLSRSEVGAEPIVPSYACFDGFSITLRRANKVVFSFCDQSLIN